MPPFGQPTRLMVFRLLVQKAAAKALRLAILPAGWIWKANTPLATHLGLLENAGLIVAKRQGRFILYSANMAGLRGLSGLADAGLLQGASPKPVPRFWTWITCTC